MLSNKIIILIKLITTIFLSMFAYDFLKSTEWNKLIESIKDWAPWVTVIATALSPLIAVQVTRFLDSKKEIDKKREDIFTTIFALRSAMPDDYNYFTRLNLIPIYFINDKNVIESFENYFDTLKARSEHLSNKPIGYNYSECHECKVLNEKCTTAQITMIEVMAEALNVSIPKHIIATKGWYPSSYSNENNSRTKAYNAISDIGSNLIELKRNLNILNSVKTRVGSILMNFLQSPRD